jgi:hypothetical protein
VNTDGEQFAEPGEVVEGTLAVRGGTTDFQSGFQGPKTESRMFACGIETLEPRSMHYRKERFFLPTALPYDWTGYWTRSDNTKIPGRWNSRYHFGDDVGIVDIRFKYCNIKTNRDRIR